MRKETNDRAITDEEVVGILYKCHSGLMKAYKSQKLFSDELYHLSQLAEITGDLVKDRIPKQKEEEKINQKQESK